MNCLSCSSLDLRKHPKHAVVGYGRCSHETMTGVFESITYERKCDKFTATSEETRQKRVSWWVGINNGVTSEGG